MALLNWTAHPLIDVGIATVCAMAAKSSPEELTLEDLDAAAERMQRYYFSGAMTAYLTCVFMNSEYVQPGEASKKATARKAYAERVLFAHRVSQPEDAVHGLPCAFSSQPATHLIHRGQMPLVTGDGVLNFVPAGQGGIAIAGPYLTALQALPLGGRRTEGKLLIAHADDPSLTITFAGRYLAENQRLLNLMLENRLPAESGAVDPSLRAQLAFDKKKTRHKMPDAKGWSTLILNDLSDVLAMHQLRQRRVRSSLSVYWLSSSGQGPSLEIYHFPSNLVAFLSDVSSATTAREWNQVIATGWTKEKDEPIGPGISRNAVFQDLAVIYSAGFVDRFAAKRFLRRHLLCTSRYGPRWEITKLFLQEVLLMSPQRIDSIRQFADNIFRYIQNLNYPRLANDLTYARSPHLFRGILVRAQRRAFGAEKDLPFGFDDYINAFHAEDSAGITDWWLVRDLILIRLFEQLHKASIEVPEDPNRTIELDESEESVA